MKISRHLMSALLATTVMTGLASAQTESPVIADLEGRASNGDHAATLSLANRYLSGDGVDINFDMAQNLINDLKGDSKYQGDMQSLQLRLDSMRRGAKIESSISGVSSDPTQDDFKAALSDQTLQPVSLIVGVGRNPEALRSDRDGLLSLYPQILQDTGFSLPKRSEPASDGSPVYNAVITNIRNPKRADLLCRLLKLTRCDEQQTPILQAPKDLHKIPMPNMTVHAAIAPQSHGYQPPSIGSTAPLPQLVASVERNVPDAFENGYPPASVSQAQVRVQDLTQRIVDVEARVQTAQALAISETQARQAAEKTLKDAQDRSHTLQESLDKANAKVQALEKAGHEPASKQVVQARAQADQAQHNLDLQKEVLKNAMDEKDRAQLHELALLGQLRVAHAATDAVNQKLLGAQSELASLRAEERAQDIQRKLDQTHNEQEKKTLSSMIATLKDSAVQARKEADTANENLQSIKAELSDGQDRIALQNKLLEEEKQLNDEKNKQISAEIDRRMQSENQARLSDLRAEQATIMASVDREKKDAAENDAHILDEQRKMQHDMLAIQTDRDNAHKQVIVDMGSLSKIRQDMMDEDKSLDEARTLALSSIMKMTDSGKYSKLISDLTQKTRYLLSVQKARDLADEKTKKVLDARVEKAKRDQIRVLDKISDIIKTDPDGRATQNQAIKTALKSFHDANSRADLLKKQLDDAQIKAKASQDHAQNLDQKYADLEKKNKIANDQIEADRKKLKATQDELSHQRDENAESLKKLNKAIEEKKDALNQANSAHLAQTTAQSSLKSLQDRIDTLTRDAQRETLMLQAAQRLASKQADTLRDEDLIAHRTEQENLEMKNKLIVDHEAASNALRDALARAEGENKLALEKIKTDSDRRLDDLVSQLKLAKQTIEKERLDRAQAIENAKAQALEEAKKEVLKAHEQAQKQVDKQTEILTGHPVISHNPAPVTAPAVSQSQAPVAINADHSDQAPVFASPLPNLQTPKPAPPVENHSLAPVVSPPVVRAVPVVSSVPKPDAPSAPKPVLTNLLKQQSHGSDVQDKVVSNESHKIAEDVNSKTSASSHEGVFSGLWQRLSVLWGGNSSSQETVSTSKDVSLQQKSAVLPAQKPVPVTSESSSHPITPARMDAGPASVKPVVPHSSDLPVLKPSVSIKDQSLPKGPQASALPVSSVPSVPSSVAPSVSLGTNSSDVLAQQKPSLPLPEASKNSPVVHLTSNTTSPDVKSVTLGKMTVTGVDHAHSKETSGNVHDKPKSKPVVKVKPVSRPVKPVASVAKPVVSEEREMRAEDDSQAQSVAKAWSQAKTSPAPVAVPSSSEDSSLVPLEMNLPPGVSSSVDTGLVAIPQQRKGPVPMATTGSDDIHPAASTHRSDVVFFRTLPSQMEAEIEVNRLRLSLPSNLANVPFYLVRSSRGYTIAVNGFEDMMAAVNYCKTVRMQNESCQVGSH